MSHFVGHLPMESAALNLMECLNELFILFSSYFLLLFTNLIPDVETRYYLGDLFMYILIGVIALDVILIVFIMGKLLARRIRLYFEKKRIETLLKHDIKGKLRL